MQIPVRFPDKSYTVAKPSPSIHDRVSGLPQRLLLERAPCEGCRHFVRCAATGEACKRFAIFVAGKKSWQRFPNEPQADIGRKLGHA
jgi:hypothetical protein